MYSITTNLMPLNEANSLFEGVNLSPLTQVPQSDGALSGLECYLSIPTDGKSLPAPALVIRVPGVDRAALRRLGSQEVWHINLDSENWMHKLSFVVFGPMEEGLYVPLRDACCLRPDASTWTLQLVLVGDDCVLFAHHCISGDELDDYIIGCMGVTESSGVRHEPTRIYSRQALDAVAHLGDNIQAPGRLVRLLD